MKTIWKYALDVNMITTIPAGFKVLHVGMQNGAPYMWCRVSTDNPMVHISLAYTGTGFELPFPFYYIGSLHDGQYMWHWSWRYV